MGAFATLGLLALVGARPLARLSGRVRWSLVAGVPALAGAWTVFVLLVLWRAMPWQQAPIPFGESGFNDGLTCLGCIDSGRQWRDDMAGGALVVSFDTDIDRENSTSPAGLLVYPKIAALEVGHPERFLHFYSVLRNVELEHPYIHQLFDGQRQDPMTVIAERIEAVKPTEIVWTFSQPTLWERTLAARLAAAGGTMRVPPLPPVNSLSMVRPGGALEVRTPWAQRQAALAALRAQVGPPPPPVSDGCARVSVADKWTGALQVLLLADVGKHNLRGLPDWLVGGWYEVRMQGSDTTLRQVHEPVAVARRAAGGFDVLAHWGAIVDGGTPPAPPRMLPLPAGTKIGRGCARWAHDTWWLVDPVVSGLSAVPPPPWPLPPGEWIGVAALDADHLVLASADEHVQVLDLRSGDTVASFLRWCRRHATSTSASARPWSPRPHGSASSTTCGRCCASTRPAGCRWRRCGSRRCSRVRPRSLARSARRRGSWGSGRQAPWRPSACWSRRAARRAAEQAPPLEFS